MTYFYVVTLKGLNGATATRRVADLLDAAMAWAMWGKVGVTVTHIDGNQVPTDVLQVWVDYLAKVEAKPAPVQTLDDLVVISWASADGRRG